MSTQHHIFIRILAALNDANYVSIFDRADAEMVTYVKFKEKCLALLNLLFNYFELMFVKFDVA